MTNIDSIKLRAVNIRFSQ